VKIDATSIAYQDLGAIGSGTHYVILKGEFTPPASGYYNLWIDNSRNQASTTCIYTHIDDISIQPETTSLFVNNKNIKCSTGGTVSFMLKAGYKYSGYGYMILMSGTGYSPGVNVKGVNIPLNYDPLFEAVLTNPNLLGAKGFTGNFDIFGYANASITFPPDLHQNFVNIPIGVTYIILSKSGKLPILSVSCPLNLKYVP